MKLSDGNIIENKFDKDEQKEQVGYLKSELAAKEHFYNFLKEEEAKLTNRLLDSQLTRKKLEQEIDELKKIINAFER
ncbi:MAG: hypothetical protein ACOZAR_01530 [Patescibacteria group bacterium]